MVSRSRPCCDKNGLKKGTWTPEEDRKLVAYVTRYGTWNWRQLPKFAGLSRCGKSCRLRWMNYLRPNLKRGNFSKEEEEKIIKLHQSLGNRWSAIAAELSGRTDNEIKNHWHTYLKKSLGQASISKEQEQRKKSRYENKITKEKTSEVETTFAVEPSSQQILESSECVPPPPPSMEQLSSTMEKGQLNCTTFITKSDLPSSETFFETTTSFWTEPFLRDDYDLSPIVDTEYLYPSSPFFIEELLCSYYGSFNECDTECQNFTID